MIRDLIKGRTPADVGVEVATTWEEFEPDEYDGAADGDDSVHHSTHQLLMDKDKTQAHHAETDSG